METTLSNEDLPFNIDNIEEIEVKIKEIQSYIETPPISHLKQTNLPLYNFILEEKYKEFKDDYPTLFKTILNSNKLKMLYKMIATIKKIKLGSIDRLSGEKEIGQILYNKYIDPVVSNIPE